MQGRAIGSALGPGRNGAISPGSQARLAMDRPSAWARDEDLEEGRRIHDAKAVRTWLDHISACVIPSFVLKISNQSSLGGSWVCMHVRWAPLSVLHVVLQKVGWAATFSLSYRCDMLILACVLSLHIAFSCT